MSLGYPVLDLSALSLNANAEYRYDPRIEKLFWFESKYKDDTPVNLSYRNGQILQVPRNCATIGPDTQIDWTDGAVLESPIRTRGNIRPRNAVQDRVLYESQNLLDKGESFIIQASTGIGKTFFGSWLAAHVNVPTLIVVSKEDMITGKGQWRDELKKYLHLTDDDIGIIQQNKCQVEGRKVVLAMVHSLAKDKYPEWIKEYFGLVIFDEVHRMAADTFHAVCGMFSARLRLGLTADIKRADGRDFVFRAHIGEVKVTAEHVAMKPKVYVVKSDFQLPRKQVWNPAIQAHEVTVMPHKPGKIMHVVRMLTRWKSRNAIVHDSTLEAYQSDRRVLILSELARDLYLNSLRDNLKLHGIPYEDMGFYVSGMSVKEQNEDKSKRVVLATYGMCAYATNVPEWDTLIMATPRSNAKQALGRILRELKGKKQPVVVDIVDYDSWVLRKYFNNRLELYQSPEIGAQVEFLN